MTLAYIGLGSNLQHPQLMVEEAWTRIQQLDKTTGIALSPLYISAPIESSGPEYINAVAAVDTLLDAQALLQALLSIEQDHGRKRPYRNAPRTLDLDLLLYGSMQCDTPKLILPHPRMHLRAFVIKPLLDLDRQIVIPGKGVAADYLVSTDSQSCTPLRYRFNSLPC